MREEGKARERKGNEQRNDGIERVFRSGFGIKVERMRVVGWGRGFLDDDASELESEE